MGGVNQVEALVASVEVREASSLGERSRTYKWASCDLLPLRQPRACRGTRMRQKWLCSLGVRY